MEREIKLPRVEKPTELTHINAIIYGDSGSGKTFLVGSAQDCEETSPMLFIDLEGGTRSLGKMDIDVVRPTMFEEIQDIYNYLLHENDKYRSVAVDSLTELQKKYSLGVILGDLNESAHGYIDLIKSIAPSRQDWLRTGGQMSKLIRSFRDLAYHPDPSRRVHVFLTALERLNDRRMISSPSLSGVLGEDCGAMVDFLWRLARVPQTDADGVTTIRRYLLTDDYINEEGVKYLGKSRGAQDLPKGLWDPSMREILDHILS
jgi:hypothetical protein